uniref:Alpha-1,6-mannosyl-glycoprotein 2-beta-N-acetylglucosaminyltransferase n=1 Tax=Strongyloides venezuelensis TaxID=75913 RepID=A0A0K0FVG4_STRVS
MNISEILKSSQNISTKTHLSSIGLPPNEVIDMFNYINDNSEMLNKKKFENNEILYVILIQVHDRLKYLEILINSLENVKGIENCLIIFSHDVYIAEIDRLIRSITFVRILQIYFPFNLQLFATIFPGLSEDDCPPSMTKTEAYKVNCSSRDQFDTYGHYRDPKLSQIKHHWWWKLNFVFEKVLKKLEITDKVIILEEDYFVMPDMIHVLNLVSKEKEKLCQSCNIVVLGSYNYNNQTYVENISKINVMDWYSSMHNMGMVIDNNLWNNMAKCSELFCSYDDYNWDWTLLHVSLKCMKNRMKALLVTSPRILHIGDCGIHNHDCQSQKSLKMAKELLKYSKNKLFPNEMSIREETKDSPTALKPNGGWNDIRDRYLCLHNSYTLPINKNNSNFSYQYNHYKNKNGFFPFMDLKFLQDLTQYQTKGDRLM